jgi:hypothetical protein
VDAAVHGWVIGALLAPSRSCPVICCLPDTAALDGRACALQEGRDALVSSWGMHGEPSSLRCTCRIVHARTRKTAWMQQPGPAASPSHASAVPNHRLRHAQHFLGTYRRRSSLTVLQRAATRHLLPWLPQSGPVETPGCRRGCLCGSANHADAGCGGPAGGQLQHLFHPALHVLQKPVSLGAHGEGHSLGTAWA